MCCHWLMLITTPIGWLGIALGRMSSVGEGGESPNGFDFRGMMLAGTGIAGLAFGFSVVGLNFVSVPAVIALIVGGVILLALYVRHARRTVAPVLDLSLLALPTMRVSIIAGFVYRAGIGALPFLV